MESLSNYATTSGASGARAPPRYLPPPFTPPTMLTPDVLRRLRRLDVRVRGLVDTFFSGRYHTAFKGQGMTFAEVRPYVAGDDVRALDWNVTARTGEAHVKVFEEEREQTLLLVVDVSGSLDVGAEGRTRRDLAAEVVALLTFAAQRNHDRVGLVLAAGEVEHVVPPARSRTHALRLLRDVFAHRPRTSGTDLAGVLAYAQRMLRHRSIVVVVSDFAAEGFARPLARLASRHDVVAVRLADQGDATLPASGLVALEDAETGTVRVVDAADRGVREAFARHAEARSEGLRQIFARAGVDAVDVGTGDDAFALLSAFFIRRNRRHPRRARPVAA